MSARSMAAAVSATLLVGACASTGPAAVPAATFIALRNPGFQEPTRPGENCAIGWGCSMHNDPHSFRFFHEDGAGPGGGRAYCIESVGREPWARLGQGILKEKAVPLRGARVRLSVAMKLDSMTGGKAGPSIVADSGSGRRLGYVANQQDRREGWQRFEVETVVPADTFILEVGVVFEGKGKVCVDDVRLEMTAPPPGPV